MTGDNCLLCKHLYYSMADRGYSEYTPGTDVTIICLKDVWRLDFFKDTQEEFTGKMLSSRKCNMYEDRQEIV